MKNITTIIKGCIAGDRRCQRMVYDRYRGYALKIVFRYIYHYDKAVDTVTDGFVKFFQNISRFEMGSDKDNEKILMGWLKRIMINTSIDELRKGNMLPEIGRISEEVWSEVDSHPNAFQLLLYKDLIMLVKELAPQYRLVFNLYTIDGYSHSEIAEIMNISIGTSKSNLSRARAMLQKRIKRMEEAKLCQV